MLIKEEPSALNGTRYRLQASISEPTTSAELRFPDLDHDGNVDATEASSVLAYFSFLVTVTRVYSTTVGGQKVFYTDAGLTTPLVPVEGRGYMDMNDYLEDTEHAGRPWTSRIKTLSQCYVALWLHWCLFSWELLPLILEKTKAVMRLK